MKWGSTHARGGDADDIALVLDLVRAVGLDVDLGADAQVDESGEIEQAARLTGEDLQLGDDIGHCESFEWELLGCWFIECASLCGSERLEVRCTERVTVDKARLFVAD